MQEAILYLKAPLANKHSSSAFHICNHGSLFDSAATQRYRHSLVLLMSLMGNNDVSQTTDTTQSKVNSCQMQLSGLLLPPADVRLAAWPDNTGSHPRQ